MRISRLSSGFLAVLVLAGGAGRAEAQIADPNDPCYKALSEWGDLRILTQVSLTDVSRLSDALKATNTWSASVKAMLLKRKAEVEAGTPLTAAEIETRQRVRDCLPWLRRIVTDLKDALAKADIGYIDQSGDRNAAPPRGKVALPLFVQTVLDAVAAVLKEIQAQLGR
jgi:hypothetical protein